jgi:hypothetical protein
MPYDVVRVGNKFKIVNKDTGKTVGTSETRAKAESSVRARLAGEHGWKGTKKRKSK